MNESLTKRLAHDEKGAVMLTGLFMSFFLVGSLWFVMGIGDAAIFRDRMQEAADHAAFSSAALHAKGMNFISACNLIMLVMVIVHIVLGIIHDFALAACILTLGAGCGGWVSARRAYEGYAKFMKPVLTGIHIAETVAAYGYPWLGTIKGRAGVALDSVLLFATAGLAAGGVSANVTPAAPGITNTFSGTMTGWTVGAGVELAVTDAVSVKAEYNYVSMGGLQAPAGTLSGSAVNLTSVNHVAKVGVNFHF